MAVKRISLLILVFANLSPIKAKGLFSGVPCHRPYECIFEDDADGFDNSELVGQEENVAAEEMCQSLCRDTENCVSYTWRTEDDVSNQNLCQLFSTCHRAYQNPDLTTVYSGRISSISLRINVDLKDLKVPLNAKTPLSCLEVTARTERIPRRSRSSGQAMMMALTTTDK